MFCVCWLFLFCVVLFFFLAEGGFTFGAEQDLPQINLGDGEQRLQMTVDDTGMPKNAGGKKKRSKNENEVCRFWRIGITEQNTSEVCENNPTGKIRKSVVIV